MNSSQFSISRSEVEFFTPSPITYLLFSLSLETSGEKSESPEQTTKQSMCSFWKDMSIASTTRRMSARVLAANGLLGDLDQLDGRFVEGALVIGVAAPIRVGLLRQELALVQQALEHEVDVELAVVGVANADGDVFEIDEQGEPLLVPRTVCQTSSCTGVVASRHSRSGPRGPGRGRPGGNPGHGDTAE